LSDKLCISGQCSRDNPNKVLGVDASGNLAWVTGGSGGGDFWESFNNGASLKNKSAIKTVNITSDQPNNFALTVENTNTGFLGYGLGIIVNDQNGLGGNGLKYLIATALKYSSNSYAPRFVVTAIGQTGINTLAPTAALEVRSQNQSVIGDALRILFNEGNAVTVADFMAGEGFLSNAGASVVLGNTLARQARIRSGQGNILTAKEGKLNFDLADADLNPLNGVWKTVMTMTGAGLVGINNFDPNVTLDVKSPTRTILEVIAQKLSFSSLYDYTGNNRFVVIARFIANLQGIGESWKNDLGAAILLGNENAGHARIRSAGDGANSGKLFLDIKHSTLNPFDTNWKTALTILKDGSVGINDAISPVAKLQINNIDADGNTEGYANGIVFGQTGGWVQAGIWPVGAINYNGGLAFGTQNSNTSSDKTHPVTSKMTLTSTGDLTLGTAFDGVQQYFKMDVKNGITPATGDCTAGDNTEVGRTLLYSNSTTYKLYVCTHAGWKTATLQ
jgi:hypothetical protein